MAFPNAQRPTFYNCSFSEHNGNINTYQNTTLAALQIIWNATAPGAAYNSEERHPHPRCLPRTRVDSIQNIKEWADVGTSKILWLHGPAGAGKSAVAQTMCETWAEAGLLLASFFFSRTASTRNTIERFIGTLAYQSIQTLVGHLDPLLSVIEKHPHILRQDVQAQLDKLFIGPVKQAFKLFAKRPGQKHPSFIVIDAVDECSSSENQLRLLSLILTLVDPKHALPIRFLIVSRPESHLRHAFSTLLNSVSSVESLYGALEDVYKYLDFKFAEIHDSEKHSEIMRYVPKPWPGPEVLRELTTRSGGYFIYAATIVRHVDEEGYICTDRLEEVLNKDARAPGSYPYRELDKVYSQVLSTARNIRALLRILACIIVGRRTLVSYDSLAPNVSTSTLITALFSLRQGELKTILRGLHSIISLSDGDTDDLRFYHASFSDFLLDKERSEEYHIDGDAAIEDMYKASLSLIRMPSTPKPFVPTSDWAVAVMCWSRLGLPAELLYGQLVDKSIMASLGTLIQRSKEWDENIQFRLICLLCGMILLLKEFVSADAVVQSLSQLCRTALALSFSPEQNMKGFECIQDVRTLLEMEHYKNRSWQFQRANLKSVLRLTSSEKLPVDRFVSYLSYTRDQFFHRTEFSVVTNLEVGTWEDSRSILDQMIDSFLNDTTMWGKTCQQKEREIRVNKRLIGSTKWEEIQRGHTLRRSTSWTNLPMPIDVALKDTSGHFLLGPPQQGRRVDDSDSDDEAPWARENGISFRKLTDSESSGSEDSYTSKRQEVTRRQRIESEQRRREELRDGFFRLKDALKGPKKPLSKISILEAAAKEIETAEQLTRKLKAQLEMLQVEKERLRRIGEDIILRRNYSEGQRLDDRV